jgi:ribosomal protein S18 acetylase RimI-like enzyme
MLQIRKSTPQDLPAILSLVAFDHLPAQPDCTQTDLPRAQTGQGTIDRVWWDTLATVQTIVATCGKEVVGAASYGLQKTVPTGPIPADGSGCILWLHARENPTAVDALLTTVEHVLQSCPRIYAFWFATPLTLGLEGLAVSYRPVTHQALLSRGFVGHDDWLYMAGPVMPHAEQIANVETQEQGWLLSLQEQGERIAEADIGLEKDHVGHLRWLWVHENRRGHGLGTKLFLQARAHLYDAGARSMVLYVDHDDPVERDRSIAIHLYQRHGFTIIDHLWSYWRGIPPVGFTPH